MALYTKLPVIVSEHLEARAVLGGAYPRGVHDSQSMLVHAVRCDNHGNEIQALCRRVKTDSLADRHAVEDTSVAAVTCSSCRQKMAGPRKTATCGCIGGCILCVGGASPNVVREATAHGARTLRRAAKELSDAIRSGKPWSKSLAALRVALGETTNRALCRTCDGTGVEEGDDCPTCDRPTTSTCSDCGGRGASAQVVAQDPKPLRPSKEKTP